MLHLAYGLLINKLKLKLKQPNPGCEQKVAAGTTLTLEHTDYFLHPNMYLGVGVGRLPPKYLSQLPTDFQNHCVKYKVIVCLHK